MLSYLGGAGGGVLAGGFQAPGRIQFNTTRAIEVGETAFLTVDHATNGTVFFNSVSDGLGNTWTLDFNVSNALQVYRCNVTTRIPSGTQITVTASGATAWVGECVLDSWTGMLTPSPLDQSATFNGFTTAVKTVGPTSATTQADEVAITFGAPTTAATVTGYTAGAQSPTTTSSFVAIFYNILAATGAQSATWNRAGNNNLTAVLATYKADAGGAVVTESGTIVASGAPSGTEAASEAQTLTTASATTTGAEAASEAATQTSTVATSGLEVVTEAGTVILAAAITGSEGADVSEAGTMTAVFLHAGTDTIAEAATVTATAAQTGVGAPAETGTIAATVTLSRQTEGPAETGLNSATSTTTGITSLTEAGITTLTVVLAGVSIGTAAAFARWGVYAPAGVSTGTTARAGIAAGARGDGGAAAGSRLPA